MPLGRILAVVVTAGALALGVTACSKNSAPSVATTTTTTPPPAVKFFANPPTTAPGSH